jgi:hypothetical protein
MDNLYQLIGFSQGESVCNNCGTGIKNIYKIRNAQTEMELSIGSECVQKLLMVEALPKEYKQVEKEYKNIKFNEPIIKMINEVHKEFINSSLCKSLIKGSAKATDKRFLQSFLLNQYWMVANIPYWINLSEKAGHERNKTNIEYQTDISNIVNLKFLSDYAKSKECKKFIDELVKYAEENYNVWGWTVKYNIIRTTDIQ